MLNTNQYSNTIDENDEVDEMRNYPWIKNTFTDCIPENKWTFIEYENYLNSKTNDKVAQEEYYSGVRYLKIRLVDTTKDTDYKALVASSDSNIKYKYCHIIESDLLRLDLTQTEIGEGFRYLKIYVPYLSIRKGWTTMSEYDDGWIVSKNKSVRNKKKNSKKYKTTQMMDDVMKYIQIG